MDDDLRSRAAHALRAGEEKEKRAFFVFVFFPVVFARLSPTSGKEEKKNEYTKNTPGVRTAPQRAREVVIRAQQNAAAARLARGLAAEREAKVDVQVSFLVF